MHDKVGVLWLKNYKIFLTHKIIIGDTFIYTASLCRLFNFIEFIIPCHFRVYNVKNHDSLKFSCRNEIVFQRHIC